MKASIYILIIFLFAFLHGYSQQNNIHIQASLNAQENKLNIQQKITLYNKSDSIINSIYLHNWPNSFKDRKTKLSKRFIEDFRKDLYFSRKKNLGYSDIKSITVNYENSDFNIVKNQSDILEIPLKNSLKPNDSVEISATYIIKVPNSKFTGYGFNKNGYHLRYWYLAPVVYDKGWQIMSNLNLDDLYEYPTDFKINLNVPKELIVESNLYQYETKKDSLNNYFLIGKDKTDIILGIYKKNHFKTFKTDHVNVHTDVINKDIESKLSTNILNREFLFLEDYLGKYPHKEIYIDKVTQRKDPIYGLNQLPSFLRPFSDVFKWDITMFKAITKKYLENTILLNKRKDYWLIDGLQNYLMIEYVAKFYPEIKLLGKVSDFWLVRSFNISKLSFNDKYPFIYQFTARKFLDQALTTPADSLSNFNRKIVSKYKAGLGFKYLNEYLGEDIFKESIKELYLKNRLEIISSQHFYKILSQKTSKDINWFFGDYISTSKKIDYTIKEIYKKEDSLDVVIKNKRNITTPFALYGLKNDSIIFKKWFEGVEKLKTVTIENKKYDQLVLNYENLYPEHNTFDNWEKLDRKLFNKPIKFSFYKDINDPNYNQFFYEPDFSYNFYNGLILGMKIHNRPLIKRNFEFKISPAYATKSGTVIGSFNFLFNQYFEKTSIYKISTGIVGGTLDYAPNLSYKSLMPYVDIMFKRPTLRDAGFRSLRAKLLHIDKEVAPNLVQTDQDNYSVFSLSYNFSKPDIIKELRYSFNTEFSKQFSKAALDIRFRSLTTSNTQLDFRIFAGTFFKNRTSDDYFSFGLDRANDYLFELNYLGRSENSGIFSQQFIIAEGGFKSVLPTRFANQSMLSFNSSIGLWRWIEFYNDIAFLKNRQTPVYFAYENGIRLNFIHNIFEIYFPLYSNNGWEISQAAYPQKIRFTISGNIAPIFNFFRRGFL